MYSHTYSPTHSFIHSLTHSIIYSFTYLLTHSLTHSLIHLLTHSLTLSLWYRYAVLMFACLVSTVHSYGPDSSLSTDPPTPPSSNATLTCSDLPTSRQRELCHSTRGLLEVLVSAEQDARDKCAIHFQHHKWNCYDFNVLLPGNITTTST